MFEALIELLQRHEARYRVIDHPAEGKSDVVAGLRGTTPRQGAKAMLCKSRDGAARLVLAVLPGDRKLDFRKVAQAGNMQKATLATPEEAMDATSCAIGAIPPFSFWPAIKLVVDPELVTTCEEIAFNAGRLDRSIVLDSQDYLRIASPLIHPLQQ